MRRRAIWLVAFAAMSACGSGSAPQAATSTASTTTVSEASSTVPETVPAASTSTSSVVPPSSTAAVAVASTDPSQMTAAFECVLPADVAKELVGRTPLAVTLDGGVVGLVVDEGAGPTVVGCMRLDTPTANAELSLSLASIRPGENGVTVAIAVPAGRKIRDLSWLDPTQLTITPTDDEITQFDVYSFVVSALAEPPSGATPSEAQLAGLIRQAFEGTSTAAGLAPDILSP